MVPVIVVFIYLLITAGIGFIAYQKSKNTSEDFFLASRTIGPMVFFLSLFATNMTAVAILGSSGLAYRQGIGVYGLMASSSGFVIPMTIFFIGTRLWSLGKRMGHMTQVQFFRDRWECSGIGTVIFVLSASMLVPYMIVSIMGGGRVLAGISTVLDEKGKPVMVEVVENGKPVMEPVMKDGKKVTDPEGKPVMAPKKVPQTRVPFAFGCAVVAVIVTLNVFFGGMRGTVWVNIFQTILFLSFGLVAVFVISNGLEGGFSKIMEDMSAKKDTAALLSREKIDPWYFWSYTFIPLSSIMFPHMSIMCLSARKVSAFKRTVVLYPLAIMAIWLPCVYLGVVAAQVVPNVKESDGILLLMLNQKAPVWVAGILGAGIISAVMGSDCHQVLALSTMFTRDVFTYYGGVEKYGEKGAVFFGRVFIVLVTTVAYLIALVTPSNIFELAVRFAFSGFAAMSPIMLAALFWKRSTKYGALASTLFVGASVIATALLCQAEPGHVFYAMGGKQIMLNMRGDLMIFGMMPVVPMVIGSAICMGIASLLTAPPSSATLHKYFGPVTSSAAAPAAAHAVSV